MSQLGVPGVGSSEAPHERFAAEPLAPEPGRNEMSSTLWSEWQDQLCRVGDRIIVTGELDRGDDDNARRQLDAWVEAGVTTIVDVRAEADDRAFVARHASDIRYVWAGVDDHGGTQAGAWFDTVLAELGDAIEDPAETILVHCQMGVNRGPSMAYRILLEQGWGVLDALKAIRRARPIAEIIYADSAVRHFHDSGRTADAERVAREIRAVELWLEVTGRGDAEDWSSN